MKCKTSCLVGLIMAGLLVSGCSSTYKQTNVTEPAAKLLKGKSVAIATPANAFHGSKEYTKSGEMTALAVKAAFAKCTDVVTVSTDCKDLECLKGKTFDYYVVPQIVSWEDRATEWSGIPDTLEIKLFIYDGQSAKELASTVINGRSKWFTFGGDHPQHLLSVPVNKYVKSLY